MVIDRSERVDVRIPEKTYKKIERIAEKTNQPFTPKSKNTKNPKRVVTPIILELLELGLSVYGKKQLELNETEFEDVNLTNLENKILSRLEVTIKDLVTQQVSEAILQYEHISKVLDEVDLEFAVNQLSELTEADNEDINEVINEDINEIIEDTSEIVNEDVSALEDVSESIDNEDNSEPDLLPKEIINEVKEDTEDKESIEGNSEIKSFDEAVIEIQKLKEQGLKNTAIAKELTGKYSTKKGSTNWAEVQVRRVLAEIKS